jgi:hypothetical protein
VGASLQFALLFSFFPPTVLLSRSTGEDSRAAFDRSELSTGGRWLNDSRAFVPIDQGQVLFPGPPHAVLQLFLARANPWSIVLLGYLDASVVRKSF